MGNREERTARLFFAGADKHRHDEEHDTYHESPHKTCGECGRRLLCKTKVFVQVYGLCAFGLHRERGGLRGVHGRKGKGKRKI